MEFQKLIEERRTIRKYRPEGKITKDELLTIIKAAQEAPSWKNSQTDKTRCAIPPDNSPGYLGYTASGFSKPKRDNCALKENIQKNREELKRKEAEKAKLDQTLKTSIQQLKIDIDNENEKRNNYNMNSNLPDYIKQFFNWGKIKGNFDIYGDEYYKMIKPLQKKGEISKEQKEEISPTDGRSRALRGCGRSPRKQPQACG